MRTKLSITFALIGLVLLLGMIAFPWSAPRDVQAAPAAAPTPFAYNNTVDIATSAPWFVARRLTADTTVCLNLARHDQADVQYNIDQGSPVNTVTVGMLYSAIDNVYETGPAIVSANVADAHGMLQVPLFLRDNCVLANVTNTNPVTITVRGIAK